MQLAANTVSAAQAAPSTLQSQTAQQAQDCAPSQDSRTVTKARTTPLLGTVPSAHSMLQLAKQQQLTSPTGSGAAAAQHLSNHAPEPQMLPDLLARQEASAPTADGAAVTQHAAQAVHCTDAQCSEKQQGMAQAAVPPSIDSVGEQGPEAPNQHGSQRRAAQSAVGKNSRKAPHDRNSAGTRMSLRSRNPAPERKRRKESSDRSGRRRSVSGAKAPAYATRYQSQPHASCVS